MNLRALRPAETEASPYAGYQLAYEVKKLMYDKTFSFCELFLRNLFFLCYVVFFYCSLYSIIVSRFVTWQPHHFCRYIFFSFLLDS